MKYPKTPHLPWSPNLSRDDKRISTMETLEASDIVVTEKLDGENTSLHRHFFHARSENSPLAPWRTKVLDLHNQIKNDIPEDIQICGENVYGKHSIHYTELTDYFFVFCLIDKKEEKVLSWDDTLMYSEILGLSVVPVLYRGMYKDWKKDLPNKSAFGKELEGYVLRYTGEISLRDFSTHIGKYVRKNHVQTTDIWWKNWTPNTKTKI